GSSLVDFDLSSSFWSVFVSLGLAIGFPTERASAYLDAKVEHHAAWSALIGHPRPDDFKRLTLSLITGGSLAPTSRTAAGRMFGRAGVLLLREDPCLNALYAEVRQGTQRIVQEAARVHEGKETFLLNAVGQRLNTAEK